MKPTRIKGQTPAIMLVNPKFPHNVGAVLRACSCYGYSQLWFTGNRVSLTPHEGYRLPREERMRDYKSVKIVNADYVFDAMPEGTVPVAVEITEASETLPLFDHPENALYVFGPEDGGLERRHLQHCHRVVSIPVRHCLNLAAAVGTVMYDRMAKRAALGLEPAHLVNLRDDADNGDGKWDGVVYSRWKAA
jgi:tRNA(Leu) C34 or U34 (ribose-2'-O)-methylase TrmL